MCLRCAENISPDQAALEFLSLNKDNLKLLNNTSYNFILLGLDGFWGQKVKNIIVNKIKLLGLENKIENLKNSKKYS